MVVLANVRSEHGRGYEYKKYLQISESEISPWANSKKKASLRLRASSVKCLTDYLYTAGTQ